MLVCIPANLLISVFIHPTKAFAALATLCPMTLIDIHGGEKTRPEYIHHLFENCQSEQTSNMAEVDLKQLEQCMLNSRIFRSVKISKKTEDEFDVEIDEKITFFPVPFATADSSGETKIGAFLVDFNTLGGREVFAIGGFYSTRGYSIFSRYENKHASTSKVSLVLTGTAGHQIFELRDPERIVDTLDERHVFGQIDLGYKFKNSMPGILLAYVKNSYLNANHPNQEYLSQTGATLEYEATDYFVTFEAGPRARILAYSTQSLQNDSTKIFTVAATGSYGISAYLNQSIGLYATVGKIVGAQGRELVSRLGGGRGFRGIETQSVWADQYAAGTLEYQVPVYVSKFGAVAVAGLAESGIVHMRAFHPENEGIRHHWSAGVGAYVYFKGLAIPGLGIEAGHNSRYLNQYFSVSLGIGT